MNRLNLGQFVSSVAASSKVRVGAVTVTLGVKVLTTGGVPIRTSVGVTVRVTTVVAATDTTWFVGVTVISTGEPTLTAVGMIVSVFADATTTVGRPGRQAGVVVRAAESDDNQDRGTGERDGVQRCHPWISPQTVASHGSPPIPSVARAAEESNA
ncbi:hypothetical protein ACFWUU_05415 [Kribbella sp. NPDC058693]|uniref:hypothetical protein n=1 Tax=Kribbella sp. NPDC058693 TaxID=3346602 RepID=UPI00365892C7